ncbi:MAG TPA: ethanolamine ammonia-lyase subunit EutB [Rhodoblastus sp.]|nr:ethanolamine ammonia-lyase subunit EutB [Rhodoblastus sp.]
MPLLRGAVIWKAIAGTGAANSGFGVNLALPREPREAAPALERGTIGRNVMYFETGRIPAPPAAARNRLLAAGSA